MKLLPLLLVIALTLSSCASPKAFRLEPINHKTFAATEPLGQGDVIWLRVSGLGDKHRLRLHRCGLRCNSAESVATWEHHQIPESGRLSVQIPSDGEYYFWVEDFSHVTGKYGSALVAVSATSDSKGLTVIYSPSLAVVVEWLQSNNSFKPKPLRGSA